MCRVVRNFPFQSLFRKLLAEGSKVGNEAFEVASENKRVPFTKTKEGDESNVCVSRENRRHSRSVWYLLYLKSTRRICEMKGDDEKKKKYVRNFPRGYNSLCDNIYFNASLAPTGPHLMTLYITLVFVCSPLFTSTFTKCLG